MNLLELQKRLNKLDSVLFELKKEKTSESLSLAFELHNLLYNDIESFDTQIEKLNNFFLKNKSYFKIN